MTVNSIFLAILVMACVTYLIRVAPLVLIRREIKSTTVRSFLHYVPYVTLSVMTFPAILSATADGTPIHGGTSAREDAIIMTREFGDEAENTEQG